MQSDSGNTRSLWMVTAEVPRHEPLREDAATDVGAGIAGMTTAYLLGRNGKRVIVLDDGPIAGGETSRTAAHLSWALDDFHSKIERMHGAEGARLAAESHMAAVERIESIVREERIECDFERLDGYWFAEDPVALGAYFGARAVVDAVRVSDALALRRATCARLPARGRRAT